MNKQEWKDSTELYMVECDDGAFRACDPNIDTFMNNVIRVCNIPYDENSDDNYTIKDIEIAVNRAGIRFQDDIDFDRVKKYI